MLRENTPDRGSHCPHCQGRRLISPRRQFSTAVSQNRCKSRYEVDLQKKVQKLLLKLSSVSNLNTRGKAVLLQFEVPVQIFIDLWWRHLYFLPFRSVCTVGYIQEERRYKLTLKMKTTLKLFDNTIFHLDVEDLELKISFSFCFSDLQTVPNVTLLTAVLQKKTLQDEGLLLAISFPFQCTNE